MRDFGESAIAKSKAWNILSARVSYYSSIRVVRIPTNGRPNLIQGQVEKLWEGIHRVSKHTRKRKADLRMVLDPDEFEPYLQVAFDHIAEKLNTPFDCVQASFSHSPMPHDSDGNIPKLAFQVVECWKDIAKGHIIFEELASWLPRVTCLMQHAIGAEDIPTSPSRIICSTLSMPRRTSAIDIG